MFADPELYKGRIVYLQSEDAAGLEALDLTFVNDSNDEALVYEKLICTLISMCTMYTLYTNIYTRLSSTSRRLHAGRPRCSSLMATPSQ